MVDGLVSQFTLYANTTGGAKPDFHRAMAGDQSKSLYLSFLETMRGKYHIDRIHDGRVRVARLPKLD